MNSLKGPSPLPSPWERAWQAARLVFLAPDGRLRASWRALVFVAVFAVFFLLSVPVLALLVPPIGWQRLEVGISIQGVSMTLSAGVTAYLLLRTVDRRSFRTLGLWFYGGWVRELVLGLVGGFVLPSVVVGCLSLGGWVQFGAGQLDAAGALQGLGWILLLLVPGALGEELLFRGYPFQRVVEGGGRFIAVLLLSALFGLVHLSNPSPTPLSTANTVFVGILLALAYLKTRGLWLPLGLHFAWNFSQGFVYSLPVSGLVLSYQLFAVEVGGPDWISGGRYGPEGSVLTTGVVLLAIWWMARTRRLRVSPALAKELE